MARILVTHADAPLGQRIVKSAYHDPGIERILAVGRGAAPRAFAAFLADPGRIHYTRTRLDRHHALSALFHGEDFKAAEIDTVVYVPRHGGVAPSALGTAARLSARTAEARLVLQRVLEADSVRSLVAIGSAYVYRLQPGNANRLHEDCELNLEADLDHESRSWIDCDMIFHGEIGAGRLRVVLLRVPTVVAAGGFVYLNPCLAGQQFPRLRPAGFDPICQLVSEKDVARAALVGAVSEQSGIFNVAGDETLPLSALTRWVGQTSLPLPGVLLPGAARALGFLRADLSERTLDAAHLRYGFTLDTRRAETQLAFTPAYRIDLARAADGSLRIETNPLA